MVKQSRNGSLDLIKFLLAVALVFFHGKAAMVSASGALFVRGASAVESFFIIAGFFMAKAAVEKQTPSFEYMKGRYFGLFPYHTFSFVLAFVAKCLMMGYFSFGFVECIKHICTLGMLAVPEFLLFAPLAGMKFMAGINGIEWYLSGMLLGMALLYPFIRKWTKYFCRYAAPLIFLFGSGVLHLLLGTYRGSYDTVGGVFCTGLIRALAMLSLGVFVYALYEILKEKSNLDKTGTRVAITIIAVLCWLVVFYYLNSHLPKYYEFAMVYFAGLGTLLSATGKTYLSKPLSNGFVRFLGKLSLPMFLNQGWIRKLMISYKVCEKLNLGYWAGMALFFALTIAVSLICILVMDNIMKAIRKKRAQANG
ncbi:MAG: acyltransferase [Lachnospiraceae bacterium]|nr:acyltransferase [Lachnospiraceae bacterium]